MATPELFQAGYFSTHFTTEKRLSDAKNCDHFVVEDLLDIPNDDCLSATEGGLEAAMTETPIDSPTVTSCNSGGSTVEPHLHYADVSLVDGNFSSELCFPYDDLAELEWLSNFTEESFSSEDLQKLQLIQGLKARTNETSETHQHIFKPETALARPIMSVPAKARSKRSRATPGKYWASRILAVAPNPSPETGAGGSGYSDGRKCLHCSTDKTPQWRTGPMGPKTLCNACGVRYKSGRLVPEYRPAASPTFVLTKHSNSHRKVMELRRQKEQQQFLHHPNMNMVFDVSNGDDYLIHQHVGPDFRQLI